MWYTYGTVTGECITMLIDINKQEAWKLLDAIKAYIKDYSVSGAVSKTLGNIINKLEKVTNE